MACHGGRSSFILGFSAVQLAGAEGVNLETLATEGRLSTPPGRISAPAADEAALGYLHANCSHCHNAARLEAGVGCYDPDVDFDWSLPAKEIASARDTPALQTGERALSPGRADRSKVVHLISERNDSDMIPSMPPLGTEAVDEEAVELLSAWIDGL